LHIKAMHMDGLPERTALW